MVETNQRGIYMRTFIVTGKMNGGEFKVSEIMATSRANAKTAALLSGYAKVVQVISK